MSLSDLVLGHHPYEFVGRFLMGPGGKRGRHFLYQTA